MYNGSPYRSPISHYSRSPSKSLSISSYTDRRMNKSPTNKDRFFGSSGRSKSPIQVSMQENSTPNIEFGKKGYSTPVKQRIVKPMVTDKVLDAPDVLDEFPAKIIDINGDDVIAVALGTTVYTLENGEGIKLMECNTPINAVCWINNKFLALSGDGRVELWDSYKKKAVYVFTQHNNRAAALSSGKGVFATGGADGIIHLYDYKFNHIGKYKAHDGEVCGLCWSNDRNPILASGGMDGYVVIVQNQTLLKKIQCNGPVQALTWMELGVLLIGDMSDDGVVRMIHTQSRDREIKIVTGSPVTGICYSEEWGIFISHVDGKWSIYTSDLSQKIADYEGHQNPIMNIVSNTSGNVVFTISCDERLRIWELSQPPTKSPLQSPRYGMSGYSHNQSPINSPYRTTPTRNYGISSFHSPRVSPMNMPR